MSDLQWIEDLASTEHSRASDALIQAMLDNGEDPSDTELWRTRKAQLAWSLNSRMTK